MMCYKFTMFVDSHCHLEMEAFERDRKEVIERSLQEGLRYILTVGTEEVYFEKVIEIVDTYPGIYGAIGLHPHNSSDYGEPIEKVIRTCLKHPKIVGYGEIGLDFFKNYSPKDSQIRAFQAQIEVAREEGLPIIVHSRSAQAETIEILNDAFDGSTEGVGVIHCYSYDVAAAKRFLDMGFYLSMPGTITYKNTESLTEVIRYLPADRILAETDAPFLTPNPHRGKRNEPRLVKHTIEKIASVRNQGIEETASILHDNFTRLFLNGTRGGN
ncbi:TatD family hydrolase [Syntrophorhabdus aromaticivorans]|uniref:TatD family hydrolase n=1 Tax=Syntrophorhabdus aromaticivorans TaxID=328301 RepID=A0A971S1Y9_9BACT|nr:TatD family hydrolase [Syntrophorhabdus aromaticivorans]NLW36753.1 TatD family hydrolase [Syntrophorhabdus aromaticivorans]